MTRTPMESSPLKETHSDPFSKPRWLRYASGLCMIITVMVVFSISITVALIITIYVAPPPFTPHGGVVSSSPNCSEHGKKLLETGQASTVDVAILVSLCIAISQPHAASIGGGGFALVHQQKLVENANQVFDFREVSSQRFNEASLIASNFENKTMQEIAAGASIAVPGYLMGLQALHQEHGRTPWNVLLDQAVSLARVGVPVSEDLAAAIEALDVDALPSDLKSLVVTDGAKLKKGDILKQPKLAQTLETVGKYGADALYSGKLTDAFVDEVSNAGGFLTKDDMKNYEVLKSRSINETKYSDMKIITAAPPSFGPALHTVMSTLAQFDVSDQTEDAYFLQMHHLAESLKYSFGLQTELGDLSRRNFSSLYYNSTRIGEAFRSKIKDNESYPLESYLSGHQPLQLTTDGQQHVSVVGDDAVIVTISMSIGSLFGSKQMASGFILNNAMIDFSWKGRNMDTGGLVPSQANYVSGGLRPMSSLVPVVIIPTATKCGTYIIPAATPGYRSVSSLAQVILNKASMNLKDSIARPRIHQQLVPFYISMEDDKPAGLQSSLENRGHKNISKLGQNQTIGIVNAARWLDNVVSTFADQRQADNQGFSF
ncbi:glutathione hydrolase 7-like isoform X2 [Clavelina lepadiformis]